jgi:hypothetical protein
MAVKLFEGLAPGVPVKPFQRSLIFVTPARSLSYGGGGDNSGRLQP